MSTSRVVVIIGLAGMALIATDAAVAVDRSGGSSKPTTNAQPGVAVSPTAAAAVVDPQALLAKALADALASGSVHAVARNVSNHSTAIYDDYDGKIGGIQHISIHRGHVTIRVVGPTTYFTGDKRGLTRFFNFSAAEVSVLHHRWIPITPGQMGYQQVTTGVTLASTLREDRIVAPLRLLPARMRNGIRVVGIRGRAGGGGAPKHATATMWISVGSSPLPVEFDASDRGSRLTQTFSDWGKPFRLAAPTNVFGQHTTQA